MPFWVRVGTRKITVLKKQEQATTFPAFNLNLFFRTGLQNFQNDFAELIFPSQKTCKSPISLQKIIKIFCFTNEAIMLHLDEKIKKRRTFSLL
jgi:hypothetical protein